MAGTVAMAQKLGEQAIFAECIDSTSPYACTKEKFKNDITALITPEFAADIRENIKIDYFYVSIILVSDENGKLIPHETDILCLYEPLKNAIKSYLYSLPAFYPKDIKQKERRSVFVLDYTFLYTDFKSGYYPASPNVLASLHIKQESLPFDTYPSYPGCKSNIETDDICIRNAISKFLTRKIKFPHSDELNKVIKLDISLKFKRDGSIELDHVDGADAYLSNEIWRVMKKSPKIIPAKVRGIAVETYFKIPLTITLNIQ